MCCRPLGCLLAALGALAASSGAAAQGTCNFATPAAINGLTTGNNASSPGDGLNNLCAQTSRSVWHTITPTINGNHTISLCGSSFDSVVALYSGCSNPLPPVLACDDDSCTDDGVVVYPLNVGQTYFLRVAVKGNAPGGAYSVRVIAPPSNPPTNDICATPMSLSLNFQAETTSAGASGSPISGCATLDSADVWFNFNAPIAGVYLAQVCSPVFTPVLSWHASCFNNSSLQCDSGSQLLPCAPGFAGAALAIPVSSPGAQRLRVAGGRGAFGPLSIAVYSPRANDVCQDAATLLVGTPFSGSTTPALSTDAVVDCTPSAYDVWHVFTPLASGQYIFDTCAAATFATVVSVHSACPGADGSTVLACSTSGCSGNGASATVNLTGGISYYIRVAGRGSQAPWGDYTLNVNVVAPSNDECAQGATISEGAPIFSSSLGATGVDITACGANDSRDVWFTFVPPISSQYELTTCGSAIATTLAIYTACGQPALACADNLSSFCGQSLQGSALAPVLSGGIAYRIRVSAVSNDAGPFQLAVSRVPGPSDSCSSAPALPLGVLVAGTTTNAFGSGYGTCSRADGPDVWYRFTPTETRYYRFTTCGSVSPVTLALYNACQNGTELGCGNTTAGLCSPTEGGAAISALLRAGVAYSLRVLRSDAGSTGGAFRLRVDPAGPANDACATPITLSLGVATLGSNAGASSSITAPCALDGADVWYRFTPTQTGYFRFDTCDAGTLDTVLTVYEACDGTSLACSDDSSQCSAGRSRTTARLNAGVTYVVRVSGKGSATGAFTITANTSAPPNDFCAQATNIANGSYFFDTLAATTDSAFVDGVCASALGFNLLSADVWFNYTAPRTETVTVSTCGATFDTALTVSPAGAPCPSGVYSVIACNDNAICPTDPTFVTAQARTTFPAVAGQTYLIRIGSRFGTTGSGILSVQGQSTCACDFDGNGTLQIDDVFTFLNAWFAGDPRTDANNDGQISIDDIFINLDCFFARPAGC